MPSDDSDFNPSVHGQWPKDKMVAMDKAFCDAMRKAHMDMMPPHDWDDYPDPYDEPDDPDEWLDDADED